jgi:sugar phosphate isomerase/epimerase
MKPDQKPKVCIGTWTWTSGEYKEKPMPLKDIIEGLGRRKWDGIELSGNRPHAHPDIYPAGKKRKELIQLLKDNNLQVPSYDTPAKDFSYAEGDPEVIRQFKESYKEGVDFCTDCGIPTIRVETPIRTYPPRHLDMDAIWPRVRDMFAWCSDVAAEKDLTIVWEFEPSFIINKPHDVLKMIDEVNRANFKIEFDTCHAYMCSVKAAGQDPPLERLAGGVVEFAGLLKGKIGHVHVIDSDGTLNEYHTSTHAPIGRGLLDWKAVLNAIVEAGYDTGWWSIDLHPYYGPDVWNAIEDSRKTLDKFFTDLGWK